jgi:aspartyl-tRNA(Asn)/glutamyl-tRNA(Gln) amidotransferase subunit C
VKAESVQIDVRHVAKLARIALSEEEVVLFQAQLERVLEYAAQLREPDTSEVHPAAHPIPVLNVFRDDQPRPGLTGEEALRNAPRQSNGHLIVPKVVE